MKEALKITFDKNVYEFVVDPSKPGKLTTVQKVAYETIHSGIIDGQLIPFLSETALTYEAVSKNQRIKVLSHDRPFVVTRFENTFTFSSNPSIYPGNHEKDLYFMTKAIDLGFKLLPGKRFGKLINPAVKPDCYYYPDEDYFAVSQRFADIVSRIESLGCGYAYFKEVINAPKYPHLYMRDLLNLYQGSEKKLAAGVAEWSDGDSIALHISYGLDYFCTNDRAISAGSKSVFNKTNYQILHEEYGFIKKSPIELANLIN